MKTKLYPFLPFFFFCFYSIAQQKKPLTGKEPSWVTVNQYDYSASSLEHEAEDGYIDLVFEKQVSVKHQSAYCRKEMKVLTEAGIQNSSEISVNFDPAYQQLTFHTISIQRENSTINQLKTSNIKTIQQEKELDRFIYDGSLTAVLFLEDVRKGDIIKFSYTLKGANPVFKNKFTYAFDVGYSVPIVNLYYKLLVPNERVITIKNSGTPIVPVINKTPEETVYEWKTNNIKPLHVQDNIPSWYDPFAMVMISEYQNWKEVNDWAMELFPEIPVASDGLQKKIATLRTANSSPAQQVAAALRFVQDDIRYMGIEMGESSHKPSHPDKVFAQRFGDCKDKSYLLCTILHALGIEASPVFINTTYKKTITGWLPSPKIFDHVTVRVKLGGKYYWFDPTLSLQRGDIDHISYPDYQYGLVVEKETKDLSPIKVKEPGLVKIKEVFDIIDMSGKASFTVYTDYSGSFADDMRNSFSNSSRYEMQKTFREFYAAFYEEITADSLALSDDDNTGILTTKEYYTIDNLWKLKEGTRKAFFQPYVIDGLIKKPKEIKRTMPFHLAFPARYKESIEINLPEEWKVQESSDKIETESFFMKGKFSYAGNKVSIAYEYEALKDHVSPSEADKFIKSLRDKDENFNYFLSVGEKDSSVVQSSSPEKYKKNNNSIYSSLVALLLIGGLVWWSQRKR